MFVDLYSLPGSPTDFDDWDCVTEGRPPQIKVWLTRCHPQGYSVHGTVGTWQHDGVKLRGGHSCSALGAEGGS